MNPAPKGQWQAPRENEWCLRRKFRHNWHWARRHAYYNRRRRFSLYWFCREFIEQTLQDPKMMIARRRDAIRPALCWASLVMWAMGSERWRDIKHCRGIGCDYCGRWTQIWIQQRPKEMEGG